MRRTESDDSCPAGVTTVATKVAEAGVDSNDESAWEDNSVGSNFVYIEDGGNNPGTGDEGVVDGNEKTR